jgi:2-dehydro-3-deoxyphosphooctonate aldolase (KDO 8-P synthase)
MTTKKQILSTPMTLIAGPCVIEDETLDSGIVFEIAEELKRQLGSLISAGEINLYFKASFDKANRTSIDGFRGPGMNLGLKILDRVRSKTGLPILTDFHTPEQAQPVSEVVDFMQIPAFLCRQTDLIVAGSEAALRKGRRLNVKKRPIPRTLGREKHRGESASGRRKNRDSRKNGLALSDGARIKLRV